MRLNTQGLQTHRVRFRVLVEHSVDEALTEPRDEAHMHRRMQRSCRKQRIRTAAIAEKGLFKGPFYIAPDMPCIH